MYGHGAHCSELDLADQVLDIGQRQVRSSTIRPLADAARGDHLTGQYYGRPPLLETLLLPDEAQRPRRKYLDWHSEKIFVA